MTIHQSMVNKRLLSLALCLLIVGLLAVGVESKAKGKSKSNKNDKPEKLSASKLSKYIGCQGCMALAMSIYHQSSKIVGESGSRKKMGEEPILNMLEDICDPASERGEWISKVDVVGVTGEFQLDIMDGYSECKSEECKAVVKVCEDVRSSIGESEIAEKVYRGHYMNSPEIFAKAFCNKMSEYCPGKPYKGKRVDQKFETVDESAYKAKKMQKTLKDMGMGGQMYDRASLQEEFGDMGGMGDMSDDEMPPPEKKGGAAEPSLLDQFSDVARDASKYVTRGIDSVVASVGGLFGMGGGSASQSGEF